MADRYWVGGSGTWDATTTTNWSETSGGTGGASAPTSLDDVYFDGNSDSGANFTVTVGTGAVCRTFDANTELPLEYTMTFAGSAALGIYGSLDLPATRFTRTYTGTINFLSSTTGNTINTNGIIFPLNFVFNNATGGWILSSALSSGVSIGAGSFDTAGFNVNSGNVNALFTSSGNGVRSIFLRNSTINNSPYYTLSLTGSNLTLDAGTSTFICRNGYFNANIQLYNVVLFAGNSSATLYDIKSCYSLRLRGGDNRNDAFSLPNLTSVNDLILENNNLGHRTVYLGQNLTITGMLTTQSTNGSQRWTISSNSPSTAQRTITANSVSLTDVIFRSINAAGPTIPWSGTRIGNAGWNSNITFSASRTLYWNKPAGGSWGDSNAWSLSSGGTVLPENVPLPQDVAFIQDTGLNSGSTITIFSWDLPTINASLRTLPFNLSVAETRYFDNINTINPTFCGDMLFGNSCAFTNTGPITITGNGTQTIQCNTNIPNGIVVNKSDGTLTLQSNISTSGTFTLTRGTLNLNALTLTSTLEFNTSSSQSRTINFNNGSINCGANWNATTSTNLLLTGPGSILMSSASAKSFIGGTKIYDGINLVQNGLGTLTITGTNTFGSISNNVLTSSGSTIIFPNVTTTLQNKPSLNGLTGSQLVLSRTGTSGTFTLSYSGSGLIQLDNVSVSNSVVQPASTWNAFRSTDGGGNTGWISFNSLNVGLDLYWVGGTGTWDSTANTNWALVSGGSGGVSAPTSANNVFFNGNSDAGSYTVTFDSTFIGIATIVGTVMSVTSVTKGSLSVGQKIYVKSGLAATYIPTAITSFGTGTGGIGTYNLSSSVGRNVTSVTILAGFAECRDITITDLPSGTLTLAGNNAFFCSGSFKNYAMSTISSFTGDVVYTAPTIGNEISYNGISHGYSAIFAGAGGWFFSNSFAVKNTNGYGISLITGTLDTNGQSISAGSLLILYALPKTLYLRNSNIYLSSSYAPLLANATNTILDAGTSNIYFTSGGTSEAFNGTGGLTYYNIIFITANNIGGTADIRTTNTFNNLIINPPTTGGVGISLTIYANITLNGALRSIAPYYSRPVITSATYGTPITINCNNFDVQNTDFFFINTSSSCSGPGLGDCGGNSNIVFPAPRICYWNAPAGGEWNTKRWSATDGGVLDDEYFPRPQDIAKFTNIGVGSGSLISISDNQRQRQGSVDFSEVTVPFTYFFARDGGVGPTRYIFGDLKLSSTMTITSNNANQSAFNFYGVDKTQTFDTAGVQLRQIITFSGKNTTFNIVGAINTVGSVVHSFGILNTNNNPITTPTMSITSSNIRTLNLGTSKITLTGTGTVWNATTTTNLTLNAENSTIALKSAGDQTFAGGGLTYGRLVVENP